MYLGAFFTHKYLKCIHDDFDIDYDVGGLLFYLTPHICLLFHKLTLYMFYRLIVTYCCRREVRGILIWRWKGVSIWRWHGIFYCIRHAIFFYKWLSLIFLSTNPTYFGIDATYTTYLGNSFNLLRILITASKKLTHWWWVEYTWSLFLLLQSCYIELVFMVVV